MENTLDPLGAYDYKANIQSQAVSLPGGGTLLRVRSIKYTLVEADAVFHTFYMKNATLSVAPIVGDANAQHNRCAQNDKN